MTNQPRAPAHRLWWPLFATLGALVSCTPGGSAPAAGPPTVGSPAAGPPAPEPPAARAAPSAANHGAQIYNGNCVACHQPGGQGIPNVYPSLVGSVVILGDPKAFALWVTKGQRPATMPAGRYATAMPQFGWMNAHDAAALQSYLRSNFGNAGPPVAAAQLTAALGDSSE
jgi:mono/diheme cytochrome c family protein